MARFKYLGEPPRPYIAEYGPCQQVRLPLQDGTTQELNPIAPAVDFPIGEDLGYDITDEMSLRYLEADTRFQEI